MEARIKGNAASRCDGAGPFGNKGTCPGFESTQHSNVERPTTPIWRHG